VRRPISVAVMSLMVLVFVGSPRSMVIVVTSIPLAILTAIVGLKLSGQTINTMTLGGIALAIGMLVDDATVEVENIHRNHVMNKPLLVAILVGAHRIATPTLMPRMYGTLRLTTAPSTGGLIAPDDSLVFKDDKVYLHKGSVQRKPVWKPQEYPVRSFSFRASVSARGRWVDGCGAVLMNRYRSAQFIPRSIAESL